MARAPRHALRWFLTAGAALALLLAVGGVVYAAAPTHENPTTVTARCDYSSDDGPVLLTRARVVANYTTVTRLWRPTWTDTSKPSAVEVTMTLRRGSSWDPKTTIKPFLKVRGSDEYAMFKTAELPAELATSDRPVKVTIRVDSTEIPITAGYTWEAGLVETGGTDDPDSRLPLISCGNGDADG